MVNLGMSKKLFLLPQRVNTEFVGILSGRFLWVIVGAIGDFWTSLINTLLSTKSNFPLIQLVKE